MAARIDSGIDPKFFEEIKQAIVTVYELREAMIMTSKQQVNIEVNGAASKTLVDLAGNEMKLAEAVKQTKVGYDSLEVSLNRVASLKAQYNGSTDTLIGLEKKLAGAEKEMELAMLARAKADTEASKQFLFNKRAEKEAAQTLFIERKRQIAEELELDRLIREEEKQKQAEALKTAEANKVAAQAAMDRARVTAQSHAEMTGTNVASAANANGTVVNDAERAEAQAIAAAERDLGAARTTTTAATVEETVAEEQNLTVKELLIRQFAVTKKALADVTMELKANEIAFEKGTISATEYENRMLSLTEEQLLLKKELAGTNATLKEQGIVYDGSAGKLSKFESIVQRMGLRLLANLVIFQAAIELIKIIGDTWQEQSDRINFKQNALKKAAAETANTFNQEASDMSVLKERWENVATSMQDKAEIVDILNEKFGKQIGAINGINDAEAFFRNKSQAFIDALELRGRAMAAQRALAKIYDEDVKNEMNPQGTLNVGDKIVSAQVAVWNSLFTNHGNTSVGDAYDADINKTAQAKVNVNRASNNRIRDFLNQYIAGKNNAANDIDNIYDFDTHDKAGKTPKDKNTPNHASAEYRGAKELNDAIADLKKQQIEQDVAANEEIFKNDKASLEDRLLAYQNYESDLIYIAEAEKDKKIANANAELKEIEKLQNDGKKKDAEQDKDLTDRHAAALVKKQAAEEEYQAKVASITSKGRAAIQQINDDEEKKQYDAVINATKQVVGTYQAAYDKEKALLDEKHTSGAISEKKYQEDILELNKKYSKEILQAQIDTIKASIPKFAEGTKEAEDLLNKLVELQKQLGQTKSNKPKSGVLGFTDEDLKLLGEINSEANTYLDATQNLNKALDAASQKRINNLQAEINAIEKKKNADVEAVNASLLSEDEKQKRIAEINAKAQAQEDIQNQKINDEKRKAAERDKALAIAQIVIKTALAVVNQLGAGDPYTAIPRAIAVGVLGAAELAAAIAEPIPEFWKGTDNAPKGLAKVGEKGPELVIPKHGKPWLADKEMIAYLHGGEQIKTHTETMEIMKMFGLGMPMARNGLRDGTGELLEGLRENAESIVGAIKSKRFPGTVQRPAWYHDFHTYNSKS